MNIYEVITLFFVLLALILGLKARTNLPPFFKIILYHTIFYFFIFCLVKLLKLYNHLHHIPNNNHIYTNINLIIQLFLLLWAPYYLLKKTKVKWLIYLTGIVFSIAFGIHIFHFGFGLAYWNGDAIISVGLSLIYLILLNQFIRTNEGSWWSSPEILTSFGILLYFAGNVPLVSMSTYLVDNHIDWYFILFKIINFGFAIIRYALLAFSFYLIYKQTRNIKISV